MTCKELTEYLTRFNPDETIGVLIVDIEKRLHHKIGAYQMLDYATPVLIFETNEDEPLDEALEEVTEDAMEEH